MKDRIKAIRREKKKNQTAFGHSVGVSMSAVQKWESGENEPSSAVITLICQIYGVNEIWLRTGKGEMFIPRTREDEIAAFLGDLTGGKGSDFQRRLVSVMAQLSKEQWDFLEQLAHDIAKDPAE